MDVMGGGGHGLCAAICRCGRQQGQDLQCDTMVEKYILKPAGFLALSSFKALITFFGRRM